MAPRKRLLCSGLLSLLPVSLLLAACAAEVPETLLPTPNPPDFNHMAALEARNYLADELDVPAHEVRVEGFTAENWPDACLGLPEPDEVCASVITPGFRVILSNEGQEYIVRTNESGSVLRADMRDGMEVESSE